MLIFLNPAAGGGRATKRWEEIAPRLASFKKFELHLLYHQADAHEVMAHAIERGESEIVAAGGDGTVNAVLNMLMREPVRDASRHITFGAIGLGSSNDFHKPATSTVEDYPCKLDFARARVRDIGVLTAEISDTEETRYFMSNASIGATADANREFNEPDRILGRLKYICTPAAILYAAMKTILFHRNIEALVSSPETGTVEIRLSNLGVVKNNHFSGNLRYDAPACLDDGLFGAHLCHGMSSAELTRVLLSLSCGRFSSLPKTRSWSCRSLTVRTEQPVNIEFDGEILTTSAVRFDVLHNAMKVCP
jgi:diacylglycerol kinase (ATP)